MTWAVEGRRARLLSHHDYGNGTSRKTFELGTEQTQHPHLRCFTALYASLRVTIRDSHFGNNRRVGRF